MEDSRIVDLFWDRDENAISEAAASYGKYLYSIAYGILLDDSDAEECVNDTYAAAWQAMPPHRPDVLSAFLGKITRRISVDLLRRKYSQKRGSGEVLLSLEELDECIPGNSDVENETLKGELREILNDFLGKLPKTSRMIFVCRYWYMDSISSISSQFGYSESKVTSILHRTRKKLRTRLEKEGYL